MKQTSKGRGNPSIRPSGRHDVFRPHPALFNPANIMVNGGVELHDVRHARPEICTVKARGKNVIVGVRPKDYRKISEPTTCGGSALLTRAGLTPGPLTILYQGVDHDMHSL
jgi:hypothetical protein